MLSQLRPNLTIVVAGLRPDDPVEYFEIDSVEGDAVYAKAWLPWPGCFDEYIRPIPRDQILRIAKPHERLPVLQKEPKHEKAG
ncbi:hypothetical protein [Algisphaera agarilytica]|uniref:Uncharacterized protein n=1 Tax=Algisphaera agarilytica TaxID=1385975 RepID=A0A7X0LKR1_9BACT|nr:hypothetical protein [Algisphaera agarilytica]MBB6429198.1 hypothetical protein [Algisphaera agarilytica]